MDFGRIIEKLIREAQSEGKFDNLEGAGKPLKLDQESEEAETWAAHHLLKNNDARPAWLEEDLALRADLDRARASLTRSRDWRRKELESLAGRADLETQRRRDWVEAEWVSALARFRQAVDQVNRRRRTLNLQVPNERFQRPLLDAEAEIARLSSP
jgi:DnaJ family protein C protein 28